MIEGVAIMQNDILYMMRGPSRHHHLIKYMVNVCDVKPPVTGEQGFFNEAGEFLNRKQALDAAIKSGQITSHDDPYELFSEDLW